MQNAASLADKAFSFIQIMPRQAKPRTRGLTIMADRGMGLRKQADILEAAGEFIDLAKVGIGAYRLQNPEFVQRKVDLYHQNQVEVFFAGDLSEIAFMQGVSERFYQEVKAFGAEAVEVSSAQVSMSLKDKLTLIKMAQDAGLKVIAEAGQKANEQWTRCTGYILKQIESYFEVGAWKVLVQGEGLTEGVDRIKDDILLSIAGNFDLEKLIFQAKDAASQKWFISNLSADVNLDVDDDQVIDLELMRRGLRKRGLFGLVGALK
ncbi:MAG: hypothetical protein PWP65_1659 [Clostridia bacterium]|nr:hypothetical protein [Clostridia bacterium]